MSRNQSGLLVQAWQFSLLQTLPNAGNIFGLYTYTTGYTTEKCWLCFGSNMKEVGRRHSNRLLWKNCLHTKRRQLNVLNKGVSFILNVFLQIS